MSRELAWSYFGNAFSQIGRDEFISFAREVHAERPFDTVVVTGVSGCLVGGLIAHALQVDLVVVRKEDDHSTHSYDRVEGHLGSRWVFLDDLVESGKTRSRVRRLIKEAADANGIPTSFGGSLLYQPARFYDGNNTLVVDALA
jgi:adenine/guanine phosphoribosyltransferase-like PRPP-binding protein